MPQQSDERHARLARAEAILDRWLSLYERAVDEQQKPPDASKLSDLKCALEICEKVLKIELLQRKLDDAREGGDGDARFDMDPDVLLRGLCGSDPDE